MRRDAIAFHNVGELREVDGRDGLRLQRVPEAVRTELNEGTRNRMCHPAGVELRFVPEGPVRVTLSTEPRGNVEEGAVRVFWGPFQETGAVAVGEEPTTIEVEFPDRLGEIDPATVEEFAFDPRVCRIRLPGEHRGGHVFYHGVEGERRPPRPEELPARRYLAYGTSITEGEAPIGEHLTYVNRAARRLDADPINLGSCGSAYCDAAMADHIAARDDWDVATLALSINMVGTFSVEEFRERAANMVDEVAGANPGKPVACVTIYPNARDLCRDHDEEGDCEAFRAALRGVIADSSHDNVHLIEGPDVLDDPAGLTTDLVHPGDAGMIRMGDNLAAELEELLAE